MKSETNKSHLSSQRGDVWIAHLHGISHLNSCGYRAIQAQAMRKFAYETWVSHARNSNLALKFDMCVLDMILIYRTNLYVVHAL